MVLVSKSKSNSNPRWAGGQTIYIYIKPSLLKGKWRKEKGENKSVTLLKYQGEKHCKEKVICNWGKSYQGTYQNIHLNNCSGASEIQMSFLIWRKQILFAYFYSKLAPNPSLHWEKWANWRESCVVRIFGRDLEQSVFPLSKCAARFRGEKRKKRNKYSFGGIVLFCFAFRYQWKLHSSCNNLQKMLSLCGCFPRIWFLWNVMFWNKNSFKKNPRNCRYAVSILQTIPPPRNSASRNLFSM